MAIRSIENGKFEVRVVKRISGKQVERRKRGLLTKGQARQTEEEFQLELLSLKQKGWDGVITWERALNEYYSFAEKKLAYSTLSTARSVLELHTGCWKPKPIDSFCNSEIENHIDSVLVDKAIASKGKLLQYIRAVFKRQIDLGKMKVNPCSGLTYGKVSEKELIAMTRDETLLLLREAKMQDNPWYSIWRVVYELGLRSGEGLALRWSDVNFENGFVSISKSYCSKSKKIGPTKNRKARSVPLNASLATFLKELKLKSDSEHVLPQFVEWRRGEAAKALRAFQSELEIRETNFHSLRASFITHLLLNGVPVTKVQYMVGHSDLKTTQKYVRLISSDTMGATDVLAMDIGLSEGKVLQLRS
jgi:integrase